MYIGFGLSAALFSTNQKTLGLLLAAAAITTLMVFDDLRGMSPLMKLASQVAVSLLAIWIFGFEIPRVALPTGHVIELGWLAVPISLLWFVGLQNTINLIDGV
ncbi:MAG: undecaprenyl/decaprenyl-phosphate alpha-N-acetylglucosaminyl 1-phosphate transferase, partial [Chloroflexi bacterium]